MIITLVSQCEKKALNRTRRVLDAFANRIDSNMASTGKSKTWKNARIMYGLAD